MLFIYCSSRSQLTSVPQHMQRQHGKRECDAWNIARIYTRIMPQKTHKVLKIFQGICLGLLSYGSPHHRSFQILDFKMEVCESDRISFELKQFPWKFQLPYALVSAHIRDWFSVGIVLRRKFAAMPCGLSHWLLLTHG